MNARDLLAKIRAAALALEGVEYATLSFIGEPRALVEQMAELFGRPVVRHEYLADSTVILSATAEFGAVHVTVSTPHIHVGAELLSDSDGVGR